MQFSIGQLQVISTQFDDVVCRGGLRAVGRFGDVVDGIEEVMPAILSQLQIDSEIDIDTGRVVEQQCVG